MKFYSDSNLHNLRYVFGGKSNGYLNDVWTFDIGTSAFSPIHIIYVLAYIEKVEWKLIKTSGSRTPSKRYGHSAVLWGGCM